MRNLLMKLAMGWSGLILYAPAGSKPRFPPDPKSFLIDLNLIMDQLLRRLDASYQGGWNSLANVDKITLFEKAVLLLEDRRFFIHAGVDFKCVPRMLRRFAVTGRIGGISTIEQQLVRTVLRRRERTLPRKTKEVLLAWILTYRRSKTIILRSYLSMAYFGYRLHGCEEASQHLFRKDAAQLTEHEAALVASLLVYPLPKSAQHGAVEKDLYPISNISAYLLAVEPFAPLWAMKVRRRMNYGLALLRKTK